MLFSSPLFVFLFLPVVLTVFYLLRKELRSVWLVIASVVFYMWGGIFNALNIAILLGCTYIIGLLVGYYRKKRISNLILFCGILIDLWFLLYFKYTVFVLTSLSPVLHISMDQIPNILLPLGLSFITFHFISYLVDVYRGTIKAEKNLLKFSLYISFFPHMIAGPIVRYADIGPQLKKLTTSSNKLALGIIRFTRGLAKKVIIADGLSRFVDIIFGQPQTQNAPFVWLALISYALQIYYDFSGYSDMAIGLAQMFGITFNENFNAPYIARSIQDFWRRWHMTLSSWFRDYVYIPLGGNRVSSFRLALNILIVFTLTGMWHGAKWTFIIWGFYYGIILAGEQLIWGKRLQKIWVPLQHFYTLSIVLFGWLIFRSYSLAQVVYLTLIMFGLRSPATPQVLSAYNFLTPEYFIVLCIATFGLVPHIRLSPKFRKHQSAIYNTCMVFSVIALFIYSATQIAVTTYNPFIYFQF